MENWETRLGSLLGVEGQVILGVRFYPPAACEEKLGEEASRAADGRQDPGGSAASESSRLCQLQTPGHQLI